MLRLTNGNRASTLRAACSASAMASSAQGSPGPSGEGGGVLPTPINQRRRQAVVERVALIDARRDGQRIDATQRADQHADEEQPARNEAQAL